MTIKRKREFLVLDLSWIARLLLATCIDVILLPLAGCMLVWAWIRRYHCYFRSRQSSRQLPATSRTMGVLLLHGSGFNCVEWLLGRAWLHCCLPAGDFHVVAIDYAGLVSNDAAHGIDTYARGPVRQQLLSLKHTTGITRWCLVGHSMGGLIAAYYAEKLAVEDKLSIAHVLTIASPWQGAPILSRLSQPGLAVRYQQMSVNSHFLPSLGKEARKHRAMYTTVGSDVDAMVPGRRWSLDLPGIDVSPDKFSWLGHYALIAWPPLWRLVTQKLKTINQSHNHLLPSIYKK